MKIDSLECTCHSMPNQFEGLIDGKPFYFRARHKEWELRIAEPGADPVDGERIAEGKHETAGWWTRQDAEKFLRDVVDTL